MCYVLSWALQMVRTSLGKVKLFQKILEYKNSNLFYLPMNKRYLVEAEISQGKKFARKQCLSGN